MERKQMKKWLFTVSLIIILAGALMAMSYSAPQTGPTDEEEAAYVANGMKLSANLHEGDIIRLWMTQGGDWKSGYFEMDELLWPGFALLYVGVNITDPRGNYTLFMMTWGHGPEDTESKLLYLVDINVTTNQGGIDPMAGGENYRPPTNSFFSVGGTVMFNGTYTFEAMGIFPGRHDPPASMAIYKHLITTTYPLAYMLPLGIVVTIAGIALAVYSIRGKTKTRLQKMRANNKR
jgi:hypothetical protein